jgi:ElaB/YqjD/DUF883 family membrane-anchored ribosome-binding protein
VPDLLGMTSTAAVDPVRAQVEATLRQVVDTVTAVPCELVRRTREAADRAAERVTESVATSVGLARSVGELAFGSLLGIGRSTIAPSPERTPSALPPESASVGAVVDAAPVESVGRADSTADHLPLEDYESLAASHVVARLDRLSRDELVQIREFEEAHRGRRTILGKIEQLLNA